MVMLGRKILWAPTKHGLQNTEEPYIKAIAFSEGAENAGKLDPSKSKEY
jgi:hypothetical protein